MLIRHLAFAPSVLAFAACAPGGEGKDDARGMPPGFELAAAKADNAAPQTESIREIDVAELKTMLAGGNIRLIDVRRDDEVAEGMIPGAEHIELDAFDPAKLDLSDGREVVLYCRSGRRSGIAAERLASHTGEPATHLAGGYLAWEEASNSND